MTTQEHITEDAVPEPQAELTDAERNAMRAYLQRCEVRLSTLHRIGTAFISGAGLLLLIPVFFKDAVDNIIAVILGHIGTSLFGDFSAGSLALTLLMLALLAYPLLLSLAIPLYGVYMLLKDMVHFYFTIYTPGFSANLLNPTFALTGVLFSVDESPNAKHQILRYEYEATQMGFMIPFSKERHELYFDTIIRDTKGDILPRSRTLEQLKALDVLPEGYNEQNVQRFNAALGIARSLDRTLTQEVAVTEMALVRHVLYLRRIVLRYIKTLLMFIWTMFISFIRLPFLNDDRFPTYIMLSLGYLVWALGVIPIMHWPLYWIYRHRYGDFDLSHIDPQLRLMETSLAKYAYAAIASAVGALAAAAWLFFNSV